MKFKDLGLPRVDNPSGSNFPLVKFTTFMFRTWRHYLNFNSGRMKTEYAHRLDWENRLISGTMRNEVQEANKI